MASKPKSRAVDGAIPQPTFAEVDMSCWDEAADKPSHPSMMDMEDDEVAAEVKRYLGSYATWQAIRDDPAETPAREAYAAHAARHLVGVFPNARVSVEAYATAAGEELARFSADTVKIAAQHARRTCKTLPPLALLIELAQAEERRRDAQANAYREAMERHAKALRRGIEDAERIARALADGAFPDATASDVLRVYERLALWPLGIEGESGLSRQRFNRVLGFLTLAGHGEPAAVALLRQAMENANAAQAARLGLAEEDEAGWEAYWATYENERDHLVAEVEALMSAPPVMPPKLAAAPLPMPPPAARFWPGRQVAHAKFGLGTVVAVDGDRIGIVFDQAGPKWVLGHFLNPLEQADRAAEAPAEKEQAL